MRRSSGLICLCGSLLLLTGCVERRYVITTDPPGAIVYRNGQYLGAAPVDDHFLYYGNYHFTIVKDGYETLHVDQEVTTPWYEYVPLDFVSEHLIPWPIVDRREFHYKLEPRRIVNTNDLRDQAEALRHRGQAIGPPQAASLPPPVPTSGTSVQPPPGGIP